MKKIATRVLLTLLALSSVPTAIVACSAEAEDVDDAEGAARKKKVSLYDPLDTALPDDDAGADGGVATTRLKRDLVVKAMKKTQETFYPGTLKYDPTGYSRYSQIPSTTQQPKYDQTPSGFSFDENYMGEPQMCLGVCPAYYSDLVCQFYCRHPSYAEVSPNIRGCFSTLARGKQVPDKTGQMINLSTYSEIYAYCLYAQTPGSTTASGADAAADASPVTPGAHGFDIVKYPSELPIWDEQKMLENKKDNIKLGVVKWVDDNERQAFQHVMYTWYNPFVFSMADQQLALNEFFGVKLTKPDYGPSDTADVEECRQKRMPAPYDPTDGTHCSSIKVLTRPRAMHPNAAAIAARMRQLHITSNPSL